MSLRGTSSSWSNEHPAARRPTLVNPNFDEALARLQYLVDNRRPLGLVAGPRGSGKSRLAQRFVHDVRRQGADAVIVDLLGMDETEFLWSVANQLGANASPQATRLQLWRLLTERIAENICQRIQTIVLCEHADQASVEVRTTILRLVHSALNGTAGTTFLLTAEPATVAKVGEPLLELCELRVELETWSEEETAHYVESVRRGSQTGIQMETNAVRQIQELTGGVPRKVAKLSEMSLLAAVASDCPTIDATMIQEVFCDLCVSPNV